MLKPKDPSELAFESTLTTSEDALEATLEIKSDRPMDTMDLIEVLVEVINELVAGAVKEQTKS